MIPSLDAKYWAERYADGSDGWDVGTVTTPLKTYFDQLTDKRSRILIPGAGRGYEAEYLHKLGFQNVYVIDLTDAPFKDLLARCPDFPKDHLIVGDFFQHQGQYDRIIEQTFFCALDPHLRADYVIAMERLLAPGGRLVGLLFNDPAPGKVPGSPPYGGSVPEYMALFSTHFKSATFETCYNSIAPRADREVWMVAAKDADYAPIACSLHDQYLAWATERRPVRIEHRTSDGEARTSEGVITDVSTRADRSEWLTLDNGTSVRLDRILRAVGK